MLVHMPSLNCFVILVMIRNLSMPSKIFIVLFILSYLQNAVSVSENERQEKLTLKAELANYAVELPSLVFDQCWRRLGTIIFGIVSNALLMILALGQALDIQYHNVRKNEQVGPVNWQQKMYALKGSMHHEYDQKKNVARRMWFVVEVQWAPTWLGTSKNHNWTMIDNVKYWSDSDTKNCINPLIFIYCMYCWYSHINERNRDITLAVLSNRPHHVLNKDPGITEFPHGLIQ